MRLLFLFLLVASPLISNAQFKTDSAYLKHKRILGVGFSVSASEQIDRATSFYFLTGKEWGVSKKVKFAAYADILKFSWAEQTDEYTTKHRYDRARFFSFSNRVNLSGKYIFKAQQGQPDIYKKYLEFGAGYNLPLFYNWKEVYGNEQVKVNSPNNFHDFYVFTKFFFVGAFVPLTVGAEFHPMDVIVNRHLPDMPIINITFEIPIFYTPEKVLSPE
jgi:hypothetical protein